MKKNCRKSSGAFTLVELMLALAIIAIITAMTVGVLSSGIFSWQASRAEWDKNLRRHNVADVLRRDISSMLPVYRVRKSDDSFVFRFEGDSGDEVELDMAEPLFVGEKNRIGFAVAREYFGSPGSEGAMWVEFYIDNDIKTHQQGLVLRRVPLLFLYTPEEKSKEEIIQLDAGVKNIVLEYSYLEPGEESVDKEPAKHRNPRAVKVLLDYGKEKREMEIILRAGHDVGINLKGRGL